MTLDGHAIEVRLYAEDAHRHFLPQSGVRARLAAGRGGAACAIDHGIARGQPSPRTTIRCWRRYRPWRDARGGRAAGSSRRREDTVALAGLNDQTGVLLIHVLREPAFGSPARRRWS